MAKKYLISIALTVGSAAAPALTFGADAASGLYQIGTNNIGLSVGGAYALNVDVGGLTVAKSLTIGTGGNLAAGSIYSDVNWGMLFKAKQTGPLFGEFLWTNSGGTELMRLSSTGGLNISEFPYLSINSTAAFSPQITTLHRSNTPGGSSYFIARRARAGTTAVVNGDNLGAYLFQGHDGTNFLNGPYISSVVDGVVSLGVMPAAMQFWAGGAERIRITGAGNTLINKTTADAYAGLFQIGYSAAVISPGTGNTAMFSVGSVTAYSTPTYQLLAMYHHGTTEAGNLDYCPSVAKANVSELIAVNCNGLVITTNTGFVAIGAAAAERARFAADGVVTLGGLVATPALKITPSASQTRGIQIIGGTASAYATITTLVGGEALRIGVKGSAPELIISATNGTNEGGQLTLEGAAANLSVVFDNYAGALRIMNTGVVGSELLVIGTTGNATVGNAVGRDGLINLDVKNVFATGTTTGAILRLISRNAADTGDVAANIVKYRSGSLYIGNDETNTSTGVINIGTASATQVQIGVKSGSNQVLRLVGDITNGPRIDAIDTTGGGAGANPNLYLSSGGVGSVYIYTNNVANVVARFDHKANVDRHLVFVGGYSGDGSLARITTGDGSNIEFGPHIAKFGTNHFNQVQIQAAATGSPVYVYAVGGDTNVPMYIGSKGSSSIILATGGAALNQFEVKHTADADRRVTITGAYSANATVLDRAPRIDTSAGSLDLFSAGVRCLRLSDGFQNVYGVLDVSSYIQATNHVTARSGTSTSAALVLAFQLGNGGPGIYWCSGAPSGSGYPAGSLCIRTDGGASTRLYSTNGTTWYAMTSA